MGLGELMLEWVGGEGMGQGCTGVGLDRVAWGRIG